MKGLTDEECCDFVEISTSAFYNYCSKNPKFVEEKERWKHSPSVKAKINVVEAIERGDADMSKWWLERRNKEEFSTKQEVTANVVT